LFISATERSAASSRSAPKKDIYTAFCSSLLFPLHERLKRHDTVSVRRAMEESQWWSAERLHDYQLTKFGKLLRHAQSRVPYYRRLFEEIGFAAVDIESLAQLDRLPFLSKECIRENIDALKAEHARGLAKFSTGGSSGEPLTFFIGSERVSHDVAAKWRATRWWGVDIGHPEIVVWGSPIERDSQDRVRRFRDKLLRTKLLPAFDLSHSNLDHFIDEIRRVRPRMLFGYPSALAEIARYAQANRRRMDDLEIEVAFVTAERLYEDQRETIARVFGCAVANGYGGRDAGFIAHECPHGGMHITAEDIIVEIVGAKGMPLPSGEPGEIVVTHLATRDFPFIRYRTGDVGVLDDRVCSCGRGLPLLREVQGRTTDFVVAADGTLMHGLALIYAVRELPGIRAFKIVQEDKLRTRVLVIRAPGFDERVRQKIAQGLHARLGTEVEIAIEEVAELPAERSGKFRYVVSKVARDCA
jgi:phenylacetate-CoA ligase